MRTMACYKISIEKQICEKNSKRLIYTNKEAQTKNNPNRTTIFCLGFLAEMEGFEPPCPCGQTVFKTASL